MKTIKQYDAFNFFQMLRLGIIGCGKVTTMFHIKAIKEVESIRVVSVADSDQARMKKVKAKSAALRGYSNYRELISDPDVDAVVINTPPIFHEEMIISSLKAGKHVLCEKPMTQSVDGCYSIKEIQQLKRLVVLPGHNYAFTPSLEVANKAIDSGEIGDIRKVSISLENNLSGYRSKTGFRLEKELGIVEDIMPHILSVIQLIAGKVHSVDEVWGWRKHYKVVDNMRLIMTGERGIAFDCSMNWTSLIPRFSVQVEGDLGKIDLELMKHPFRVLIEARGVRRKIDKKGFWKYLEVAMFKHPSFQGLYRHFFDVVKGLKKPIFTVEDEMIMLSLMNEAIGKASVVAHERKGIETGRE